MDPKPGKTVLDPFLWGFEAKTGQNGLLHLNITHLLKLKRSANQHVCIICIICVICVFIHIFIFMIVCMLIFVYQFEFLYIYTSPCIYIYIFIYTYIHMFIDLWNCLHWNAAKTRAQIQLQVNPKAPRAAFPIIRFQVLKCSFQGETLYGGFLKWWYPTTMDFPTKNDHFGVWNGGSTI